MDKIIIYNDGLKMKDFPDLCKDIIENENLINVYNYLQNKKCAFVLLSTKEKQIESYLIFDNDKSLKKVISWYAKDEKDLIKLLLHLERFALCKNSEAILINIGIEYDELVNICLNNNYYLYKKDKHGYSLRKDI